MYTNMEPVSDDTSGEEGRSSAFASDPFADLEEIDGADSNTGLAAGDNSVLKVSAAFATKLQARGQLAERQRQEALLGNVRVSTGVVKLYLKAAKKAKAFELRKLMRKHKETGSEALAQDITVMKSFKTAVLLQQSLNKHGLNVDAAAAPLIAVGAEPAADIAGAAVGRVIKRLQSQKDVLAAEASMLKWAKATAYKLKQAGAKAAPVKRRRLDPDSDDERKTASVPGGALPSARRVDSDDGAGGGDAADVRSNIVGRATADIRMDTDSQSSSEEREGSEGGGGAAEESMAALGPELPPGYVPPVWTDDGDDDGGASGAGSRSRASDEDNAIGSGANHGHQASNGDSEAGSSNDDDGAGAMEDGDGGSQAGSLDTIQRHQQPDAVRQRQLEKLAQKRKKSHIHGRGAGAGRDLDHHGEPKYADMHPSWQAKRKHLRHEAKAVSKALRKGGEPPVAVEVVNAPSS